MYTITLLVDDLEIEIVFIISLLTKELTRGAITGRALKHVLEEQAIERENKPGAGGDISTSRRDCPLLIRQTG